MATDNSLTNAIIALLTPKPKRNTTDQSVMDSEAQAASVLTKTVDAALATIPAASFPVEKEIIDGIVGAVINILMDEFDNGVFDVMTNVRTAKQAAQITADALADQKNPTKENEQKLEDDASSAIRFVGKKT